MKSSPALLMLIEEEEKMCYTATTHRQQMDLGERNKEKKGNIYQNLCIV